MTIQQRVIMAQDTLKQMTTHTQLRDWAEKEKMCNASAFPKFKKALLEIGIDYVKLKLTPQVSGKELELIKEKIDAGVKLTLEEVAAYTGGTVWENKRIYYNAKGSEFSVYNGIKYATFIYLQVAQGQTQAEIYTRCTPLRKVAVSEHQENKVKIYEAAEKLKAMVDKYYFQNTETTSERFCNSLSEEEIIHTPITSPETIETEHYSININQL